MSAFIPVGSVLFTLRGVILLSMQGWLEFLPRTEPHRQS